jgi:hypothetical protein
MEHDLIVIHEKGHRCTICNSVNIVDIETDIGDYKDHMSFTPDPSNKEHFICIECAEAIQEIRYDYAISDEELEDGPEKRHQR